MPEDTSCPHNGECRLRAQLQEAQQLISFRQGMAGFALGQASSQASGNPWESQEFNSRHIFLPAAQQQGRSRDFGEREGVLQAQQPASRAPFEI